MSAIPAVSPTRKVLLFDVNHRRREIRAANLRTRGVDVVCAKDLAEVRDLWHIDTFRLVLLEALECPEVVTFSLEVHSDDPRQRLAFFVGKPKYLSFVPAADDTVAEVAATDSGLTLEEAFKSLSQKNGFVEASLRMQILRSSRRGATTVKPARAADIRVPKDPWAAMKALSETK